MVAIQKLLDLGLQLLQFFGIQGIQFFFRGFFVGSFCGILWFQIRSLLYHNSKVASLNTIGYLCFNQISMVAVCEAYSPYCPPLSSSPSKVQYVKFNMAPACQLDLTVHSIENWYHSLFSPMTYYLSDTSSIL